MPIRTHRLTSNQHSTCVPNPYFAFPSSKTLRDPRAPSVSCACNHPRGTLFTFAGDELACEPNATTRRAASIVFFVEVPIDRNRDEATTTHRSSPFGGSATRTYRARRRNVCVTLKHPNQKRYPRRPCTSIETPIETRLGRGRSIKWIRERSYQSLRPLEALQLCSTTRWRTSCEVRRSSRTTSQRPRDRESSAWTC